MRAMMLAWLLARQRAWSARGARSPWWDLLALLASVLICDVLRRHDFGPAGYCETCGSDDPTFPPGYHD